MFNSDHSCLIIPLRITDIERGEPYQAKLDNEPSSFESLKITNINTTEETTEETIDETIEEKYIIEWTIDYLIKAYKAHKSTRNIIKDLAGCRTFELYNSTYPTGIGKHLNCDDIPLLYTVLLFPKEAKYVGVTQDIIDSNPVIKNLCNMCPNMCIPNKRYFGRNIVGMNNNPLLVVDLPFTSVFIS
jgi:hypothetical protein